jgi:conjugative relaxase-like TrwC/TraI family protein
VLSRGKVTPATVSYYTDTVAAGIEDYYAGHGEAPGEWVGSGSSATGLEGAVRAEDLALLFDGVHPGTGESLGAPYNVRDGADRVTGWDLTFSAPKTVSALWATAGADVGMEVREAHDAAVAAGVDFLEEHAAFARQGKAGVRQVDTDGYLSAAFVHRSSRAGDPQLHTHVLVSGRVRCSDDGVWRALDSRGLHRQLKPAGMVYQAALRVELTARLGVAWSEVDRNGQAEIDGVPPALRRLFSKRTDQVEPRAEELIAEAEAKLGRPLTTKGRRRFYEVAVLETRPAKETIGEGDEGLFDRWQGEAVQAGLDPDRWVARVLDRTWLDRQVEQGEFVAGVIEELAGSRSTWTRTDVIRHVARRCPVGLAEADEARQWIETRTDEVLVHPSIVGLAAPEPAPPAGLRRRDGRSVFERHHATRYTTQLTLAVEQQVLDIATQGRNSGRGIAHPAAVDAAITRGGLGDDQAAAVRAVTQEGDTVATVIGPAGSGKSRMMGAATQAWTASGIPVRGLAVSAAAAGVLQVETGLVSDTIAKFLHERDRPGGVDPTWQVRPGEVLVVDEASMVASRDLARLVLLAEGAQGKVVLVGDWAQLGAVEAGGLFRLLAQDHNVELTGIRRFDATWERAASRRLRDRDPTVLDLYEQHGRVVGGDRAQILDEAFTRWQQARAAGESIVLCASDHHTVDALAGRCQAARIISGEVERDGVQAGAHCVGVGDEIVTLRNDRRLLTTKGGWVRNGDRWLITACHPDGSLSVEDLTGRGRLTLPSDYATDDVTLAYAVTVHKAQGLTVEKAVLITDERTTAESLYVGMTRGRRANTALVVTDSLDLEHTPDPATPRDGLTGALARVSADVSATETLRQMLIASESLAVLKPRLANLDAQIRRDTPPDRTIELERIANRRNHMERHARPGRLTRTGREDRRILASLEVQEAELEAALQHRRNWLDAHADTFAYRAQLAEQVTTRTEALSAAAVAEQPRHVVDLLGPFPDDEDGRAEWARSAGRVEAYREEFGIDPEALRARPVDGVQHRQWDTSVHTIEITNHLDNLQLERSLDHDRELSLEHDLGLEL